MSVFDKKPVPTTFSEALMGDLTLESMGLSEDVPLAPAPVLTERALVLESFTRFAEEKIAESPEGVVKFPGGEILKRDDPAAVPLERRFADRAAWEQHQRERLGARSWDTLTLGKSAPLVLFIGEALREESILEQPIDAIRPEFLLSFLPPVADLFQKMVQAMKLAQSEYVLMALTDKSGEKTTEELLEDISWWAPRFVVPLGARACQAILGQRERLATVHGKFYPVPRCPSDSIQVAPLFHPSVIASNTNMKKSTWTDMQKIMQALGKA
jgi:hypothetical protein